MTRTASLYHLSRSQALVLAAFLLPRVALTDEQLVRRIEEFRVKLDIGPILTPARIRSVRAELSRGGLLERMSVRGWTATGRRCALWRIPRKLP
jgi:hypothetical protein